MSKQFIRGSFFTSKDYDEKTKYLGTKRLDNVSQGFKPTGNSLGVLFRFENVPLAYYDIPTVNSMVFSKRLWSTLRENPTITHQLETGALWGEAAHAERDEILLPEVALRVSDFRIDSKNLVTGDVELLDTPNGAIVYTLSRLGRIGNSSRGWGSLRDRSDGLKDVVDEDYLHTCWDAVTLPAVPDALFQIASSAKHDPVIKSMLEQAVELGSLNRGFVGLKEALANPDKIRSSFFPVYDAPEDSETEELTIPEGVESLDLEKTPDGHKIIHDMLPEPVTIESKQLAEFRARVSQGRNDRKYQKYRQQLKIN